MNDDKFTAEALRLATVLADMVETKRVSVRSLEKKMGVGDSVFSKVLKGKITLQVRHVLLICEALDVEWKDFFAAAYGLGGVPAALGPPEDELDRRLRRLLIRYGLLKPDAPEPGETDAPPSAEQ
jgi:transcriptional regulator with XRE-family HTH domain